MSLASTTLLKAQMETALGPKVDKYYDILRNYLRGSISRVEYDERIKDCLGTDNVLLCEYFCHVLKINRAITCTSQ